MYGAPPRNRRTHKHMLHCSHLWARPYLHAPQKETTQQAFAGWGQPTAIPTTPCSCAAHPLPCPPLSNRLVALLEEVVETVNHQMQAGDLLLLPGGWGDGTPAGGHALLYVLQRSADITGTFRLAVCNTGKVCRVHGCFRGALERLCVFYGCLCVYGVYGSCGVEASGRECFPSVWKPINLWG